MMTDADCFRIVRNLPHDHVAAVLGTAYGTGSDALPVSRSCRKRQLVMAMIVDRILSPGDEAALNGRYVVRSTVPSTQMSPEQSVDAYQHLATVERAFHGMKTINPHLRTIYHWDDDRIRAHVFLCMLPYDVEWHLRQKLQEVLCDDDRESAQVSRRSVVAPPVRSESAKAKNATERSTTGYPVQSVQDLLENPEPLCRHRHRHRIQLTSGGAESTQPTESTPLQGPVPESLNVTARGAFKAARGLAGLVARPQATRLP